jgi:hypothetical protein
METVVILLVIWFVTSIAAAVETVATGSDLFWHVSKLAGFTLLVVTVIKVLTILQI